MATETCNSIIQNSDALLQRLAAYERLIAEQFHVAIIDKFAYLPQLDWSRYLSH